MGDQGRLSFFTSLMRSSRGAVMEAGLVQQHAMLAGGSTAVLSEQRVPSLVLVLGLQGHQEQSLP